MKEIKIKVFKQIRSPAAVTSEDGELLFSRISKGLEEKDTLLILDWKNITLITPTFLNVSIGQLYGKYDSAFFRERLKVKNLSREDLELLKEAIKWSKEYFKDIYNYYNKRNIKGNSRMDTMELLPFKEGVDKFRETIFSHPELIPHVGKTFFFKKGYYMKVREVTKTSVTVDAYRKGELCQREVVNIY